MATKTKVEKAAKPAAIAPTKSQLEKLVDKGKVKYKGKLVEVLGTKPNPRDKSITDCRVKVGDDSKWVSGRSVQIAS
jgi:hypothetical protein